MILDRITAHKKLEVQHSKNVVPLEILQNQCDKDKGRPFSDSLRGKGDMALIAEIKKASPSKGLIREQFEPEKIAGIYTESGASAISVLTDVKFFQGDPGYLRQVKRVSSLPLLRKDFIIDRYQVYEAKVLGADAILLIMAILNDTEVDEFLRLAEYLGMDCLVEVHTADELVRALSAGARTIGINNRNLQTFKTDINTTFRLRQLIHDPDIVVVSESGINTRHDVEKLIENGIDAMLVGEALMREKDIGQKIYDLLGRQC